MVDPFADIDEDLELQHLIEQTGCENCTPQEFISGDDDLPVCVEMDDENCENTFLEELSAAECEAEDASQEMDKDDDEYDDGPVVPKLKTYKEAINSLEDVCQFLEHKGHGIEALSIGSSINHIVALKNCNSRQATLPLFRGSTVSQFIVVFSFPYISMSCSLSYSILNGRIHPRQPITFILTIFMNRKDN